jgi:integrase
MIVTFLLTGARLREIVQLDRADVDLHQSTIRLHRKVEKLIFCRWPTRQK